LHIFCSSITKLFPSIVIVQNNPLNNYKMASGNVTFL
jgi:hypothetical protein